MINNTMTQQQAELETGLCGRFIAPLDPMSCKHTSPTTALQLNAVGDGHRYQLGRWQREHGTLTQRGKDGKPETQTWAADIFKVVGYGASFAAARDMVIKHLPDRAKLTELASGINNLPGNLSEPR